MSGDVHVRFCENVRVRFPRATHRNVYVRTKAAGERVMASLEKFLAKRLRLKLNRTKSVVGRPWSRKFLGYSMTMEMKPRLKAARESVKRAKEELRRIFQRGRGR